MGGAKGFNSMTLFSPGIPGGGAVMEGAEVKDGGMISELSDALRLEGIEIGGFPS